MGTNEQELKSLISKINILLLQNKVDPASRNLSDENQKYTEIKTEFKKIEGTLEERDKNYIRMALGLAKTSIQQAFLSQPDTAKMKYAPLRDKINLLLQNQQNPENRNFSDETKKHADIATAFKKIKNELLPADKMYMISALGKAKNHIKEEKQHLENPVIDSSSMPPTAPTRPSVVTQQLPAKNGDASVPSNKKTLRGREKLAFGVVSAATMGPMGLLGAAVLISKMPKKSNNQEKETQGTKPKSFNFINTNMKNVRNPLKDITKHKENSLPSSKKSNKTDDTPTSKP
jgi:hypothetical protein